MYFVGKSYRMNIMKTGKQKVGFEHETNSYYFFHINWGIFFIKR